MPQLGRLILPAILWATTCSFVHAQQSAQTPEHDSEVLSGPRVEEVNLKVTVTNRSGQLVKDLTAADFTVYEDGKPQKIDYFRAENTPITLAILVDTSASMLPAQAALHRAVTGLIQESNSGNEVALISFSDEPTLEQGFTRNTDRIYRALDHLVFRGDRTLYDAVFITTDELGPRPSPKKVLVVITGGADAKSHKSVSDIIQNLEHRDDWIIYVLGFPGNKPMERDAQSDLQRLCNATGGVALFLDSADKLEESSRQIAQEIGHQYDIGYTPSNPLSTGGYRKVKVEAQAPRLQDLQVRTRSGYSAGKR
ncbi:MAG TPA: VWA domain-containing protein [Terriglobales bacterium]|jgi:Ca-activated chloride channel family protein|nr:VWA domain-containing protein [Terriglobales bacterium]